MAKRPTTQKEALNLFAAGADRLEAAVSGLTEAQLDLSAGPGEWTIRQIVHHVADDGDVWSMILKKALATPGARVRFEDFPGNEAWADALHFAQRPVEPSLALIKAHRRYLASLLARFAEAWERTVTIADAESRAVQSLSVGEMMHMLTEHLQEHVTTIEAIRQQHGLV